MGGGSKEAWILRFAQDDGVCGWEHVVRERQPAVYIVASGRGGTLYVGVTADLVRRVGEHRVGEGSGFAGRYGCRVLVWFELFGSMEGAIQREKAIKGWVRARKVGLIVVDNPLWKDLYPSLLG